MNQFNPIIAAENIKASFIDYITTSFRLADPKYASMLKEELLKEGYIAKGPYLDITGSYQTGASLDTLIANGQASALFPQLEPIAEADRELKIHRPLYSHQEQALRRASAGKNLVVTTGTGSGKTECFLIPTIDALLKEIEVGTLDSGVRAIVIYPMNALANDQMKRMRALLKHYPQITFGLYNGNTKHKQSDAQKEYRITNGRNSVPLDNELISREMMQENPPHILITNYSMLEYMMLRPKDDKVFAGAKLRYIVLDEAHIYKGTTGMETSMLMRRLCARISNRGHVQFILTSATLGDTDANDTIVDFAERLTGVQFSADNIIRSADATPPMIERLDFPIALFCEIAKGEEKVPEILSRYHVPDFCPDGNDDAKIFDLLLHSNLFARLSENVRAPITITELTKRLHREFAISQSDLIDFIAICTRAEKGKSSLIKAKYHFFVRALEGAYVTLGKHKKIFLQRKEWTGSVEDGQAVFEIAVCPDCGRMALVGQPNSDGYFKQVARKTDFTPAGCGYYLVWDDTLGDDVLDEDDVDEDAVPGENDFVVCTKCGRLAPRGNLNFGPICECTDKEYIPLKKINPTKSEKIICGACGFGTLRAFYVGSDAATSVLGTELFEQLPDEELEKPTETEFCEVSSGVRGLFSGIKKRQVKKTAKEKQFLCFSDSRSEAAYFAVYMEKSYQEFLRRRGMWQVVEQMKNEEQWEVSIGAFVNKLTRFFDTNKTFEMWTVDEKRDSDKLHEISKSNAWIAILNEMYNARRGTSLPALGVLSFQYAPEGIEDIIENVADWSGLNIEESYALLQQLVMDGVYSGALNAGNSFALDDAEREYIFFSSKEKALARIKTADHKSNVTGWAGRTRTNGNFYPNARLKRLTRATTHTDTESNEFLLSYWDGIFAPAGDTFVLDANEFVVKINGNSKLKFYRCKKCGRLTPFNVGEVCSTLKCDGGLELVEPMELLHNNHYARLYSSTKMKPLQMKEHTAQLAKNRQTIYQQAFVNKKINALSCSTTFEMGVDVGGLETVYMRNVPPGPANYVQRAGRAGRASHTAAFVLTYAKLSSHDFTFYQNPEQIISGKIKAPIFSLKNEKVIYRHIFAVALSKFLACHEDIYAGDNVSALLNEGGYETLKAYLEAKPEDLKLLLKKSIPEDLHEEMELSNYGWTKHLIGGDGVLQLAVTEYQEELSSLLKLQSQQKRSGDLEGMGKTERAIKQFRCGSEDGQRRKSLIDFLVRNNVLPKYGFPVDTVELQVNAGTRGISGDSLQLARDLQMAIAEYAPGSQVIADGELYTSRYIRKLPGKDNSSAWEKGYYCECPSCGEPNFTKEQTARSNGRECISCGSKIQRQMWQPTLEPRRGFWAEGKPVPAPLKKPERDYKTDDYYVGDIERNEIKKSRFAIGDFELELESTANDSLVVVGKTEVAVCPYCGYATDELIIPMDHKDARGYPCQNKDGTNKAIYRLSHTFKSDVAKITFYTTEALDCNTMLSVLYALLEGVSRELGIERTDIKGCLHQVKWSKTNKPIYSVVLYDAVAGGAGHVRRIVTDDGEVMQRVISAAIKVVKNCSCDTSCYQCIRNYYNQKIHDILDRHRAEQFLQMWLGEYQIITNDCEDSSDSDSEVHILDADMCVAEETATWGEFGRAYQTTYDLMPWDAVALPMSCFAWPKLQIEDLVLEPEFIWSEEKVAIFASLTADIIEVLGMNGWACLDIHATAETIKNALGGDNLWQL